MIIAINFSVVLLIRTVHENTINNRKTLICLPTLDWKKNTNTNVNFLCSLNTNTLCCFEITVFVTKVY